MCNLNTLVSNLTRSRALKEKLDFDESLPILITDLINDSLGVFVAINAMS
jgi:hypothetical protein